jgi:tRNA threonylcarbamoyladenosine biosynthesis protein TsaB
VKEMRVDWGMGNAWEQMEPELPVLGIDTSTWMQTVALISGDGQRYEKRFHAVNGHTATLLESIDGIFEASGLSPSEIALVAVGIGPGSFTGLRIGVSAAKAFCHSVGMPLVGVNSLEAMANRVPAEYNQVITAIDARKKEVYGAVWGPMGTGGLSGLGRSVVISTNTFSPEKLVQHSKETIGRSAVTGNGLKVFPAEFSPLSQNGWECLEDTFWWPDAVTVAALGTREYRLNGPHDLNSFEPCYIRPSEAELLFRGGARPIKG